MVELLMTMLLLTVVLMGLTALQIGTIQRVTASRRANEATRLAQTMLERYRHIGWGSLPADTSNAWIVSTLPDGTNQMANVGVDGVSTGPFTVEEFVQDDTGPNPDHKIITIRVTWRSQDKASTLPTHEVAIALRRVNL